MNRDIIYVTGGVELLDAVGPLWEQLNEHHGQRSSHFAGEYAQRTFAQRKAGLLAKAAECAFRVDLAQDPASGRFVGYCVSTVDRALVGEVESIFVDAGCRGLGIGDRLMQRALAWMDRQDAQAKKVGVAAGNEEAIAFYQRYGFLPRYIILAQKHAGSNNAPETR